MELETYRTLEVAELLGVSRIRVHKLLHEGRLALVSDKRPWTYSAESVHRLIQAREFMRAKLLKRPTSHRFRLVETDLLPNDPLLTSREVSFLIGVSLHRVQELVREGRLRAFQREPGKAGSRLLIPQSFVTDLMKNDSYLEYRQRWQRSVPGKPRLQPSWQPPGDVPPIPAWNASDPNRPSLRINYGRYYSAAQTAARLGVTKQQVLRLRKTGRLTGYRRDPTWEYRKSLQIGPSLEERWEAFHHRRELRQMALRVAERGREQEARSGLTERALRDADEVREMRGWEPERAGSERWTLMREEAFEADADEIILSRQAVSAYKRSRFPQYPRWFFLKEEVDNLPSVWSWRKAHRAYCLAWTAEAQERKAVREAPARLREWDRLRELMRKREKLPGMTPGEWRMI